MKRFIAILLAAVCTACLLVTAACGKGGAKYDPENFLTAAEAKAQYNNEYRIVKDQVEIQIFVPRGTMNPAYSTMKMFKKLSEITNLKFDFIEAETSSYTNLRTTAWMDGELPDFFLFGNTVSEQVMYSEEGELIAFNDNSLVVEGVEVGNLIDNYMPTYKALLDKNFNIDTDLNAKQIATMLDGKMYSTVSAKDVPRDMTYKMWINEKWIENINTMPALNAKLKAQFGVDKIPTAGEIKTIDDFLLVLRAFKKLDANANGNADDEIPATALAMQYLRNFLLAAYGAVSNGVEISNDGKSFNFTPATQAYREYLKVANIMFKEGLIDNSTFSYKTDSQLAGPGYEGKLGVFCAAAAYLVVGYGMEKQYGTFGPLSNPYTEQPIHYGFSPFQADVAVIPKGTPYVREIARLLDVMYSDIGVQLISYGEEGVDWTWNDEEKTAWTFNVPESWTGTQEEYRATITPNVGTGAAVYWSYDFVGKMDDELITRLNKESEIYVPYIKVPMPDSVILNTADYNSAAKIMTTLDKYIEMIEYNFITGEVSGYNPNSDSDWNEYLKTLKGYKYEELVAMYNTALNRK